MAMYENPRTDKRLFFLFLPIDLTKLLIRSIREKGQKYGADGSSSERKAREKGQIYRS